MKNFDFTVYIGRFQPFHNGHLEVILKALEYTKYFVIFIGSAQQSRNSKNYWTFEERKQMILNTLENSNIDLTKIFIEPLNDYPLNDSVWLESIKTKMNDIVNLYHDKNDNTSVKIALTGYFKDSSSYYLNYFSDWEMLESEYHSLLNATDIRTVYLAYNGDYNKCKHLIDRNVPYGTQKVLQEISIEKDDTIANFLDDMCVLLSKYNVSLNVQRTDDSDYNTNPVYQLIANFGNDIEFNLGNKLTK